MPAAGEGHRSGEVGGVVQDRRRGLERGDRQRQHAAKRGGIDGHRCGGDPTAREDLGEQSAE